ncbi:transmembrane 134 [Solea senegalensis]|uniref:Transmembrane 134 n=1 Tax=Solea senegalensis TaxID=28829 RepID=A0AAV6Q974_SOLSE|nr:transmembrane protein 134 [Solea senegalensis]XP_058496647.1 transmembrane protein 134 [Solea solea]KAG7486116.1 transmembrane 134 [Solea senegalensis]
MATQFSIDDAFVLEGEEEGAVSDGETEGWKGRNKDRDGGEMTFGTLSFTKPQTHSVPSATGSPDHSNQKYQNLENEDAFGSNGNSSFNNLFKISDPATLSYCSSQWSFSTLSSVTQLSAHCCGWVSHPLVKKNRRVVLASFLLLITGLALIFTGVVIQLNPSGGISSAIFFVPGFLLFIPGVYHVIYISCAVRGRRGFKLFYLPYFEK